MTQSTTQITAKRFFRQDTKPNSAPDGATWVTESDGSGNDTVSRYQYDTTADTWELNSAVGPSEPNAGTNVPGATWRDTTIGKPKQYDGTSWVSIGNSNAYLKNNYEAQLGLSPGERNQITHTFDPAIGVYEADLYVGSNVTLYTAELRRNGSVIASRGSDGIVLSPSDAPGKIDEAYIDAEIDSSDPQSGSVSFNIIQFELS